MPPFSVVDLLAAILRFCWERRRVWADMAMVPIALTFAVETVADMVFDSPSSMTVWLAVRFVLLFPLVMFAVAWQRYCLLGAPVASAPVRLAWGTRETRFLGMLVKLLIAYIVLFIPISALLGIILGGAARPETVMMATLLAAIPVALVLGRLAIGLPAAALDRPMSLREAWRYGEGNSWRVLAVIAGTGLVGGTIVFFLAVVTGEVMRMLSGGATLSLGPLVMRNLIFAILMFVDAALMSTALAFLFRHLTGWRPDGSLRPLPPG